jgi:hypothetical protein
MIDDRRAEKIGAAIMFPGAISVVGALAVMVWQSVFWLRMGYWPQITILDAWRWAGLAYPQLTGWAGIDKLIGWALNSTLSSGLFWFGLALGGLGAGCHYVLSYRT